MLLIGIDAATFAMLKPVSQFRLLTRTNAIPTEYFILANLQSDGPVVGHLAGKPIREAVIDQDGRRYRFTGVMPRTRGGRFAVESLVPGEWIVQPGLIYALDEPAARRA
ncbi:hypothetical protein ACHMW4_28155 [Mesorhizobium sp. UC22_110]|uniref:hypothetical protein n=2 Tax=unclassified Mesorhizobium TaxID=325217 RepID=UPI0036710AAD